MTDQKLLLRTIRGRPGPRPPVWIMRQAGRYLPEYRAIRKRAGGFLRLCYTPELAAEASLLPVERFGLDATIVFSDILLLPQALGSALTFEDGHGPRLSRIQSTDDIARLEDVNDVRGRLAPVYETIRILRAAQPAHAALIGFAGSPWTVATYMISGNHALGQTPALTFLRQHPVALRRLIELLTEATIIHLAEQIRAGAELVKLFDTWAGRLSGADFDEFVATPNKMIVGALKAEFPDTPIIVFPRGSGHRYRLVAESSGADCLALDQTVDIGWARKSLPPRLCLQGNLDPALLISGGERLVDETCRIIETLADRPHIFNLGHGITPEAPIGNVELLIETVRNG